MSPKAKSRRRPRRFDPAERGRKKRPCQFCVDESLTVDYKDVTVLRKFLSDRGKIRSRRVTGACPRHQREVATAVKNAREMALLPYINPRQQ